MPALSDGKGLWQEGILSNRLKARRQIDIKGLCLGEWPAPFGQAFDANHDDLITAWPAQHGSCPHQRGGAVHHAAIDAQSSAFAQALRVGAGRRQAREPQKFVDPQSGSVDQVYLPFMPARIAKGDAIAVPAMGAASGEGVVGRRCATRGEPAQAKWGVPSTKRSL